LTWSMVTHGSAYEPERVYQQQTHIELPSDP
jgi:hypothetical protein